MTREELLMIDGGEVHVVVGQRCYFLRLLEQVVLAAPKQTQVIPPDLAVQAGVVNTIFDHMIASAGHRVIVTEHPRD